MNFEDVSDCSAYEFILIVMHYSLYSRYANIYIYASYVNFIYVDSFKLNCATTSSL